MSTTPTRFVIPNWFRDDAVTPSSILKQVQDEEVSGYSA